MNKPLLTSIKRNAGAAFHSLPQRKAKNKSFKINYLQISFWLGQETFAIFLFASHNQNFVNNRALKFRKTRFYVLWNWQWIDYYGWSGAYKVERNEISLPITFLKENDEITPFCRIPVTFLM